MVAGTAEPEYLGLAFYGPAKALRKLHREPRARCGLIQV